MKKIEKSQHYHSFNDFAVALGLPPFVKQTKDQNKLKSQREKFQGRHICPACKQPMEYVDGTSVMVCINPACKGVKKTSKDEAGNEVATYIPSFDLLDRTGSEIAENIFGGQR